MDLFAKNIDFLLRSKGKTQTEAATDMGFRQTTLSMYKNGKSKPNYEDLLTIIKYFGITASELIETDLENVEVIGKSDDDKSEHFVEANNEVNVEGRGQKGYIQREFTISIAAEKDAEYSGKKAIIPITDISVAAGPGYYNNSHVETVEAVQLPPRLVRPGYTYLCVKIKGESMAPTLQDGGYVIIRQLDKAEWAKMPDERVFVVVDNDGKACLKRVKNRFKQGFIVLRSDSPDQATYPSFNLNTDEIVSIWYVEWYFSAKMPNIHDQFYSRLQRLEDKMDDLLQARPKGSGK